VAKNDQKKLWVKKKTPRKTQLKKPTKRLVNCGGTNIACCNCLSTTFATNLPERVKMRGCKLDQELIYHKPVTITCCVYHDSVWFGNMIWLTKKNTILQHPMINGGGSLKPRFSSCGARWWTHWQFFQLPNLNHRKASLWLIYIQLHYVSSDHIWC
jgi:hypothetical protein